MYFAYGLRDVLSLTELNREFFEELDSFQIHFIDMCFKQALEAQMGMLTELEFHNYELFEEFKLSRIEEQFGVDPDFFKKAG